VTINVPNNLQLIENPSASKNGAGSFPQNSEIFITSTGCVAPDSIANIFDQ
jgi:hypothetical protein